MSEFLWCKNQTIDNNSHRWTKFILFIRVISETWKLLELLEELEWISEGKQLENSSTKPRKPSYSNLLICDKREKSCELDDWSSPPWNGKQISKAVCNCKLSGDDEHCHGLSTIHKPTIPHPKKLKFRTREERKEKPSQILIASPQIQDKWIHADKNNTHHLPPQSSFVKKF